MATKEEEKTYQPKDAVGDAVRTTMIMGGVGFTVSAIQNTLTRQNVGAWGVFTRTGGVIALFVSIGATYGFSKSAAANLREKDDSWNPAIGGFLAGSIGGLRMRSFPHTVGFGAGLAVLQGVFDFTGGKFSGYERDPELNEYERREQLRKQRRRPIQETLDELGEGRGELPSYTSLSNGKAPLTAPTGIYGPGYRQRRADRIKDAYGIDVPRT